MSFGETTDFGGDLGSDCLGDRFAVDYGGLVIRHRFLNAADMIGW